MLDSKYFNVNLYENFNDYVINRINKNVLKQVKEISLENLNLNKMGNLDKVLIVNNQITSIKIDSAVCTLVISIGSETSERHSLPSRPVIGTTREPLKPVSSS